MSVGGVLTDAWAVYRLLLRRSVLVAAVVYFAIAACYRLTDPGRPTIDPVVRGWPSVWKGPA